METRLNIGKVLPGAYKAMQALDTFNEQTSLDKLQRELIKIRASQINGCAYCVDKHSYDARKAGATEQWVFLVSAWREAGAIFSEEERAILQMTEEMTLIHRQGLSEATYSQAIAFFGEEKTAEIMIAIVMINAWNRTGVGTHMAPVVRK